MNGSYNISLVLLSYAVATFAAYTTLDLAARIGRGRDGQAWAWLGGGALAMGLGIWAMHFIGMLALHLPVQLSFDVPITLASIVPAIAASALALLIVRRPRVSAGLLCAGAVSMGLGIAAMHYTGMAALRMEPDFDYEPWTVVASVAIAIGASYAALSIALRSRQQRRLSERLAASAVMGFAIVAMHYTGMAATRFAAGSVCLSPALGVDSEWLATMIGIGTCLLMLAMLMASVRDARALEARTRIIVETALDCIITMDATGRIIEFNPAAEAAFGYLRAEVLGQPLADCIIPPALRQAHTAGLTRYLRGGQARLLGKRIEISAWRRDGTEFPVELAITATPIGAMPGFTAHLRDLSERKLAEQSLRLRGLALDSVDNGICIVARRGAGLAIEYVNPAFVLLSGHTADELLGQDLSTLATAKQAGPFPELCRAALRPGAARGRTQYRRRDGHELWCELFSTVLHGADGEASHSVLVLSDTTAAVGQEQQLVQMANFDGLTGLPNRLQLRERLDRRIAQAARRGAFGVLFIDLDHFKVINDSLGHDTGDELLKVLAQRLKSCVRDGDMVARLGGDEFVLLVDQAETGGDAAGGIVEVVVQRLRARVAEPVELHERTLHVTCSIGLSMFPGDGNDAETLLRKADAAMYLAKREGRNDARAFTGELEQAIRERLDIENQLRSALQNGEFLLHYQPLVSIHDGAILGAEALIRWQHPERGLLAPGHFVALAEETGLIEPIGAWVLREACRQALPWRGSNGRPLPISVNLSARQLQDGRFFEQVMAVLFETGLAPERLVLELTESLFTDENETVANTLRQLAERGVRLAVDDFGTGYSNLRYLKRFPVSRLKIDRSFVACVSEDEGDAAIATAIIALAHGMHLDVVGEGVETEAQQRWLAAAGCELAQGWLFARPEPAEAFALRLAVGSKVQT